MRSLLCRFVKPDVPSTSEKRPATIVEGGDVYPLHTMDQDLMFRKLMVWTLYFDDVLDARKLHASLARLLEIGDWRKVGARLRFDKDGKLSSWVPEKFTDEYPAIMFHHTSHADTSIDKHPMRSWHMQPGKHAFVREVDRRLFSSLMPAHFPSNFIDLVQRQLPQLSLHVFSFCDATIVQTSWPHTLSDALGQQALLRNWSLVLAGREESVERVIAVQHDVLERVTQDCKEAYLADKQRQTSLQEKHMALRIAWRVLTRPKMRAGIICVPSAAYQSLLGAARDDVGSEEKNQGRQTVFISDADILTAWSAQQLARSESKSKRGILVIHLLNARYRLPILRPRDAGGVYMQNMVLPLTTEHSAPVKASVGEMALHQRQHLVEHATEQQILASTKFAQGNLKNGSTVKWPVCASAKSLPLFFNNLGAMNLITVVDFSPAAVPRQGVKNGHGNDMNSCAGEIPRGRMVYFVQWLIGSRDGVPVISSFGEDHAGNLWLSGLLWPNHWASIRDELHRLQDTVS